MRVPGAPRGLIGSMRRLLALGSFLLLGGVRVSAQEMATAASEFLARLDDAQRARALLSSDDEARFVWQVDALERRGLPLGALTPEQRAALDALLATALTPQGTRA